MRNLLLMIVIIITSISNGISQTLQSITNNGSTTTNGIFINSGTEGLSLLGNSYLSFKNSGNSARMAYVQHDGSNLVFNTDVGNVRFLNNLGIGLGNPTYKLDVFGEARIATTIITNSNSPFLNSSILFSQAGSGNIFGVDGSWTSKYFGMKTDGTFVAIGGNVGIGLTAPSSKLDVAGVIRYGNNSSSIGSLSYGTELITLEALSSNTSIAFIPSGTGNVGIGTTTPKEKLSVNGKIRAKEIKVETTNWPDYVFAKSYPLPTLQETEKHIKEKGHLPGIPSAEEVKANGIDLGTMNAKLLQKIEELTLYLIEMKKESTQDKINIKELKALTNLLFLEVKQLKSKI
jgi:hypothetical protein